MQWQTIVEGDGPVEGLIALSHELVREREP